MKDLNQAGIINLEQLYLLAICKTIEAEKLQAVLQDMGEGKGRLWLVPEGSTIPQAHLMFQFGEDAVKLGLQTRSERSFAQVVTYAEGVEGFLRELQKVLRAGKLEHKRAA